MYVSKIKPCFYIFSFQSKTHSAEENDQKNIENDSRREFNEQCENELLFIAGPSEKPLCIACEIIFSHNRRHDLSTMKHYEIQHQTEIEGIHKIGLGSDLLKEYVTKKKKEIRRRQNVFTKRSCESLADRSLI